MAFFSAFADVPSETAAVRSRRYLSWLARFVSYGERSAFTYLYAHTLIRTELGGIVMRLTRLGMVSGMLSAYGGLCGLGLGGRLSLVRLAERHPVQLAGAIAATPYGALSTRYRSRRAMTPCCASTASRL